MLQDVHSVQCGIGQLLSAADTCLHVQHFALCFRHVKHTLMSSHTQASGQKDHKGGRTQAQGVGGVTSITGQNAVCPQGETCEH